MKKIIETERLILREIIPEDENGLFELDSNKEVHRYLGNNPVQNIDQIRTVIKSIKQQYVDNGVGRWAIIEKKSNSFIGWTGFKLVKEQINNQSNFYDLGYRLIKRYWNQGYATETVFASLKYGFDRLKLEETFAVVETENLGSNKVLRKTGFSFKEEFMLNGILCNWYRMGCDQWNKNRTANSK